MENAWKVCHSPLDTSEVRQMKAQNKEKFRNKQQEMVARKLNSTQDAGSW